MEKIEEKKFYYNDIVSKIKLKFIDIPNEKIFQPWKGLDFFYLIKGNDYLHIPSNTQLSEFLNKFNEAHIIPKLGEYHFKKIYQNGISEEEINEMILDYGWNWMNWNSDDGKKVIKQLTSISNKKIDKVNFISRSTLKILGRLKLKESTDYGKQIEKKIDNYLLEKTDLCWEVEQFLKHLDKHNFVVIAFNKKILDPEGLLFGEIDFLLMDKAKKEIYVCDLKTSVTADKTDYWRQLLVYRNILVKLNPHLKNKISEKLIIIHINQIKKISDIYIKDFKDSNLKKLIDKSFELKKNYLNLL